LWVAAAATPARIKLQSLTQQPLTTQILNLEEAGMNLTVNLKSFTLGVASTMGVLGAIAFAVSIPNAFSSGEVISAAKMNANFAALKTAIDTLESGRAVGFRVAAVANVGNCTQIDNVATNNKPNAIVSVSFSRNGSGVVKPVGPFFNASSNKWLVCTNDNSAQIDNVEYQILVLNP
jgi:hypothetical protein